MKYCSQFVFLQFLVLLMNITLATESPIAKITGETFLGVRGNSSKIQLNKEVCELKSLGEKNNNSFRIIFKCNNVIQILFDTEAPLKTGKYSVDDPQFSLLWAGDKDMDGKIDIVMEMSPKYSYSEKVTYLTTKAKKGQLLGIANISRVNND